GRTRRARRGRPRSTGAPRRRRTRAGGRLRGRLPSKPASEEADVDDASDPDRERGDDRNVEVARAVEALRQAEQDEHRQRPAQLERDDRVDLARTQEDGSERYEPDEERGRGDLERVYAGFSDLRNGTRSWSSAVPCSSLMSTT